MADATSGSTSASTWSSILTAFNSLTGLFGNLTGAASQDASAAAADKVATFDAEAKANKERMAIETKDLAQAQLSAAETLNAEAMNVNDPYYGRPATG
jgi:high-affinity K+ transport system ATPase subunit B